MARPRLCRNIKFDPHVNYFKPQGIPVGCLEVVELALEEVEAIRLKNIEGLEQTAAAKKMDISQSTYQRILVSAGQKITDALVNGKAIKIGKKKG